MSVCWPAATSDRLGPLTANTSSLADGKRSSGLQDRAHGLDVITDGRCQKIDLVLHREDRCVLGEQRERRIATCAVGERAGGSGVDIAVLLVHFGSIGQHDVHASWPNVSEACPQMLH